MINISKYLDARLVAFMDVDTRDEALNALVDMVHRADLIADKEAFYEAIIDREKIVSTGIGMGVAIPHAKLPAFDHFFVAIGVLHKGIEWNALDHAPVRIIFMIGGPDDKQTEYLQILSSLTVMLKDEQRRKKMLTLNSGEAILALFEET